MTEETVKMMKDIMDTEQVGYAYVYPFHDSARQEYYISTRPDHLADFIAEKGWEASKILVTDIVDRPVVSTRMCYLDQCMLGEAQRQELLEHLLPLQMKEKEPGTLLAVERSAVEEYFSLEEQGAGMAEYGLELGM